MSKKRLDYQDFCNMIGYILCLPGSNAERIFFVINSVWTKEKSRLSAGTMKAMLLVRQNYDIECDKFYMISVEKSEYAAKDCFIRNR